MALASLALQRSLLALADVLQLLSKACEKVCFHTASTHLRSCGQLSALQKHTSLMRVLS
jgi:thymidine kinase